MIDEVLIRGDGVAAYCCAYLLKNAGFRVTMDRRERRCVPAIMLSDAALALIRDVFGRPTLLSGASRITRRVVAWGENAKPIEVPHSAVVVHGAVLLEDLAQVCEPGVPASPEFVIHASKPLPATTDEHRFGSRSAVAAEVVLTDNADASACWIESVEDGWLFLVSNALAGVGAPLEMLLARSRLIAPRVALRDVQFADFAACPRIAAPLCGEGWIACGSAAMAFDPICGDGTAQAVREAILASAVIRAIADGGDAASVFAHYESRLTAAMLRHLDISAEFYREGGNGPWWRGELEALAEGKRWCTGRLAASGKPRYRLNGFVLEVMKPNYNRFK